MNFLARSSLRSTSLIYTSIFPGLFFLAISYSRSVTEMFNSGITQPYRAPTIKINKSQSSAISSQTSCGDLAIDPMFSDLNRSNRNSFIASSTALLSSIKSSIVECLLLHVPRCPHHDPIMSSIQLEVPVNAESYGDFVVESELCPFVGGDGQELFFERVEHVMDGSLNCSGGFVWHLFEEVDVVPSVRLTT